MKSNPESITAIMRRARQQGIAVPGFNIPYLPMMEPVVRALQDTDTFGLIMVARLEWVKFESGGLKAVRDEYERVKNPAYTRLHLDHVPVIDEDNLLVDFESIIREAIELGYDSVMVDGSRLPLKENIEMTRLITEIARPAGIPVEAELGAVLGHESGPLPPYEELFESGKGFTDAEEAARFVRETGVDWLSVAIGNIHGPISAAARTEKKTAARLSIPRLESIYRITNIPLVLHGGTGIEKKDILESLRHGITKINIATAIRQPYEKWKETSIEKAQQAVYEETVRILTDELEAAGSASRLFNGNPDPTAA